MTLILLIAVVVLVTVGLWTFQPWRLWTHNTVNEALPVVAAPAASRGLMVLAEGQFVSQEHQTTGVARLTELADGSHIVRLEGFSTSDGPDVHVWLTDQAAGGDSSQYDDRRYLPLGELKGTDGNQNYPVSPHADLAGLTSVVIWCDRFNVVFGSAPLG